MDASVGIINYQYDETKSSTEASFGVSKDAFGATVYIPLDADTDEGYTYLEGSYDMELPEDLGLSLTAGYNIPESDLVDNSLDFTAVVGKSLSQVDVAVGLAWASDDRTGDDAETAVFLSVSQEF